MPEKIIEDLMWRYATDKFDSSKIVSEVKINQLLEALRLTASSYGLQPWKFIVVENKSLRESLLEYSYGQKKVVESSHLIVLARQNNFTIEDVGKYVDLVMETRGVQREDLLGLTEMLENFIKTSSKEEIQLWMENQVYIALGSLLTVAAQMRVDTCPIGGFSTKGYDKILQLKEKGLASVVVCAVGFRDVDDPYAGMRKVRDSLEDKVVHLK